MFKLLVLLVIIGVAGYFTNPTVEAHRTEANNILSAQADAAADNFDLGGLIETGAASLTQDGVYQNLYVGSTYTLEAGGDPYIQCYGAFTKVLCNRVESQGAATPS